MSSQSEIDDINERSDKINWIADNDNKNSGEIYHIGEKNNTKNSWRILYVKIWINMNMKKDRK